MPTAGTPAQPTAPAVLIVNAHLPLFPGGGGVEALTTRHLAALAERVGLVSQAHTTADLEGVRALADAGVALYLWQASSLSTAVAGTAPPARWLLRAAWLRDALWGLARGRPADTRAWSRALRRMTPALVRALAERDWPVTFVVESAAAPFLRALPRRPRVAVLVLHDVRTRLYESRARAARGAASRAWWRLQARLYGRFEARWCGRYDLVTTVSTADADWVRAHTAAPAVTVVPLPVDADYFTPRDDLPEQPGRIVFTGHMGHAPNADAAVFFAREVLPRVRARVAAAHLSVVGRHPGRDVLALAALPGVEVTGEVPDVRPHLAAAQVVVVPLRFGAGARQKILEAWAMQRCVVSTPLGAEGLDARDGENLLLAKGAQGLAARVTAALGDAALRERVRKPGRALVRAHHDPATIAAGLYEQVQALYASS